MEIFVNGRWIIVPLGLVINVDLNVEFPEFDIKLVADHMKYPNIIPEFIELFSYLHKLIVAFYTVCIKIP